MFVDKVKISAKAGDGGNGCVSFRREKYVEYGGPDGGDGGHGGAIVLVADCNANDLSDLAYSPRIVAKNGIHGRGKGCTGRTAPDVLVKVPVGTQVYRLTAPRRILVPTRYHPAAATEEFEADAEVGAPFGKGRRLAAGLEITPDDSATMAAPAVQSDPSEGQHELIADLVEHGQRFVLAQGGRGGRGNTHFKSSTHRAPREFEYGEPGEELRAELELKTLADAGLVGFPNAGKSTLLSQISKAHPKIGAYPFTTLTPNVGVIDLPGYERMLMADIPGLIDGAHEGKGLGHDFLRHIERCRLLLFLLDMAGVDGRTAHEDYAQLQSEVKLYNPAILDKPRLVVANKMDLPSAKKNLAAFKRKHRVKVIEISALNGDGLDKIRLALRKALA